MLGWTVLSNSSGIACRWRSPAAVACKTFASQLKCPYNTTNGKGSLLQQLQTICDTKVSSYFHRWPPPPFSYKLLSWNSSTTRSTHSPCRPCGTNMSNESVTFSWALAHYFSTACLDPRVCYSPYTRMAVGRRRRRSTTAAVITPEDRLAIVVLLISLDGVWREWCP